MFAIFWHATFAWTALKHVHKKPSPLKVEWEKNAFIMNIESTGALPPERVLKEATKILGKQLNEFEEQIKVEEQ